MNVSNTTVVPSSATSLLYIPVFFRANKTTKHSTATTTDPDRPQFRLWTRRKETSHKVKEVPKSLVGKERGKTIPREGTDVKWLVLYPESSDREVSEIDNPKMGENPRETLFQLNSTEVRSKVSVNTPGAEEIHINQYKLTLNEEFYFGRYDNSVHDKKSTSVYTKLIILVLIFIVINYQKIRTLVPLFCNFW